MHVENGLTWYAMAEIGYETNKCNTWLGSKGMSKVICKDQMKSILWQNLLEDKWLLNHLGSGQNIVRVTWYVKEK